MKTRVAASLSLVCVITVALMLGGLVASATGELDRLQYPSYTPDPEYVGRKPLSGISLSSPSNGHAVGFYTAFSTNGKWQTHAQKWNGSSWQPVTTFNYSNADNFLYGLVTVSDTDAWAVGRHNSNQGTYAALILRYVNGSWVNWSITVPDSQESTLTAVAANSTTDVWAAGYYKPLGDSTYRTLVMHWDGITWSLSPSPNMGISDNKLFGVTTVPGDPNVIWVVGGYYKGGNLEALTMQADVRRAGPGTFWNIVPAASVTEGHHCLRSVSALDGDDIWTGGYTGEQCFDLATLLNEVPTGTVSNPLVERWNGSAWLRETTPIPDIGGTNYLYGISVASGSRVWAAGFYSYSGGWRTMILGRDANGTWQQHCSENPSGNTNWDRLLAIDAISGDVAWSAGWYYTSSGGDKPTLIEHYVPPDCIVSP